MAAKFVAIILKHLNVILAWLCLKLNLQWVSMRGLKNILKMIARVRGNMKTFLAGSDLFIIGA